MRETAPSVHEAPVHPVTRKGPLSTEYTRRPVTKLVHELCRQAGLPLDIIYRAINRQFGLDSITLLPRNRIAEVVEWLKKELAICQQDPKEFKASYVKGCLRHIPIRFLKKVDHICLGTKAEKGSSEEIPDTWKSMSAAKTATAVPPAADACPADPAGTSRSEGKDGRMETSTAGLEEPFDFWNPPSTHVSMSTMMHVLGFKKKKNFIAFCEQYIGDIMKLPCGTARMIACDQHDEDWYHRDVLCFLLEKSRVAGHA